MRIFLIVATFGLLAACNTIEGAGRDLSSAGKAVSETARDVKN
jgi:predicted small secreted protein